MDPSLLMPSSGFGPQPVGFSPTPADAMGSDLRARASDGFAKWALYNDPTFKRATGMLATGLAGDAATARGLLHNSGTGQFIKDAVGMAMQGGLMPGGNPVQMASNVHQMIASSGFRMGGNIGGGGQLFGSGAITDQVAKSTYQQIQNQFFDPVSGLSKRGAHGLDKSQMGDALGYLTARGAFQGSSLGDINNLSHKEVVQQLAAARKEGGDTNYIKDLESLMKGGKGGLVVKIDKEKMKKVTAVVTDYAATLKDAKEIFGNLPIAELTQNAERLIGASLTEFGSTGAMRNKMADIKSLSAAYGLNAEAVANRMMNASDAVQNQMFQKAALDPKTQRGFEQASMASAFGKFGAASGAYSTAAGIQAGAQSRAFARSEGEKGRYVPEYNEQQHSQAVQAGLSTIVDEEESGMKTALAARALLESGAVDPATKERVNNLFNELENTGDIEQMRSINNQIGATLSNAGFDMGTMESKSTQELMSKISAKGQEANTKMLGGNLKARGSQYSIEDIANVGYDSGMLTSESNKAGFGRMMSKLNDEARGAINNAIGADGSIDEAKLEEAFAKTPGLAEAMSKGEVRDIIEGMRNDPGRKAGDLRTQIEVAQSAYKGHQKNLGSVDEMTATAANRRGVQAYLSSKSLGEALDSEDFSTKLLRGFLGAGKISEEMIMQKARNDGGKDLLGLKINSDKTGLEVSADDIGKLEEKIGKGNLSALYDKLGIKNGDTASLASALGTAEGFGALQKNLGGAMSGIIDGKFSLLGKDKSEEISKGLEMDASMEAARKLLGTDKGIKNLDLSTEEGRDALNTQMREGLLKDDNKRLLEIAGSAGKSGYSGTEFETLADQYKKNPGLREDMKRIEQEQADKVEKSKGRFFGGIDEGEVKKLNDIKALRSRLDGESGGNKFLGILELASDSLMQLKLYSQGGAQ